jgi:flagellar M-ring protein FliF
MDTLRTFATTLGAPRLAAFVVVILAAVLFFGWVVHQVSQPDYALLYGDLDLNESGRIVSRLETSGIPYRLEAGGAAVFVPAGDVARLRVSLAEHGLPSGGSLGYELFDSADSFGTTNFRENVTLVRALEGELARTIRAIDAVQNARVHLVLPKRELFSRTQPEPTASVLVHMRANARLADGQVVSIQHLIASAVPGLTPEHVSLVDGAGRLLSDGADAADPAAALAAQSDERRRMFEKRLTGTIEDLLERIVGPGNVRAEVFAEMDFDRINSSEELFDPDGQVVRSTQSVEEQGATEDKDAEPVTVGTSLPDATPIAADGRETSTSQNRVEETVNYEISKKVISHVRETGIVRRLSVAVLVDGVTTTDADGVETYTSRTADEMEQLNALVRSAIGYDPARGDTIEIVNMPFAGETLAAAEEPFDLLFGLDKHDLFRIAQYLVLVMFGLLVLLLVVRPLVTRAIAAIPVPAPGDRTPMIDAPAGHPALAAPLPGTALATTSAAAGAGDADDDLIDLQQVAGRVRASSLSRVGEIVDKHPDETLAIVRSWLHAEN